MRAAMVGGGAYVAGKHVQAGRQHEQEQDEQLGEMQQPQSAPPPPQAAPPAPEVDPIAALTQAKQLLDAGVLTQAEFDSQKQRILGS